MKARKTFKIVDLLDKVNDRNRKSTCPPEVRQGWNSILESVLMDTGAYAGFGYLTADEVPEGYDPGIVSTEDEDGTATAEFPDETRRVYYYSRAWKP